jgi:ribose 5-phosphate isomerase B
MRIAFGTDHRGYKTRPMMTELLHRLGHELDDVGAFSESPVDYPDITAMVAQKVGDGSADRGLLVGGTGIGMCIVANKFAGVRAASCYDELTAELARRHNDVNVLCISTDLLGELLIDRIIDVWLRTPFDGGHHARRLEKIATLEHEARKNAPQPPAGGM